MLKIKWEHFAQKVASGTTLTDAYIEVYNPRYKRQWAAEKASRLAARPEVEARILELRDIAARNAIVSLTEMQTSLGQLFRESCRRKNVAAAVASAKMLSDICGYNAPQKVMQDTVVHVRAMDMTDDELTRVIEGGR